MDEWWSNQPKSEWMNERVPKWTNGWMNRNDERVEFINKQINERGIYEEINDECWNSTNDAIN